MKDSVLDRITRLQNGLIARATGGQFDGGDDEFAKLRREVLANVALASKAPAFLKRCSDTGQFWAFIKYETSTYQERRDLIWGSFRPLIEHLEAGDRAAGDESISTSLTQFGADAIQAAWQKALSRRSSDPEGAITASRTLVESVCKHILDDAAVAYESDADFPKLWALTAAQLNLMPAQHEHDAFKRILGNCQAVVDGLASIRNRVGDAHGKGRKPVAAKPRHAELAVNLAGAMASFLLATWLERPTSSKGLAAPP